MGMLARIFEPIVASAQINLDDINIVAFDTNGTLVHRNKSDRLLPQDFIADQNIAQLLHDLSHNKQKLGLDEVVIISGDTQQAEDALTRAGLAALIQDHVEDRGDFYRRVRDKNVLVVDDDFLLALDAQAHVNPKSRDVQDYLRAKAYRRELGIV